MNDPNLTAQAQQQAQEEQQKQNNLDGAGDAMNVVDAAVNTGRGDAAVSVPAAKPDAVPTDAAASTDGAVAAADAGGGIGDALSSIGETVGGALEGVGNALSFLDGL